VVSDAFYMAVVAEVVWVAPSTKNKLMPDF
jgi:hypothetical protein